VSDYHITEIGTLPGGTYSFASAVNRRGEVVGWGETTVGSANGPVEHALYRDPQTRTLTDLHLIAPKTFDGPDSRALDINEFGQVVGWARLADGQQRGFFLTAGAMQALPVLSYNGPGAYDVVANAINDLGSVVGTCAEKQSGFGPAGHAFLWTGNLLGDFLFDINTDLGNPPFSAAEDIDNNSLGVVGFAGFPDPTIPQAFFWPPPTGQNGDLNPGGTQPSEASAISKNGSMIVGDVGSPKGGAMVTNPFIRGALAYLFTPLGPVSEALDLNDSFQVVGQAQFVPGETSHAFLWQNGELVDLNTKIDDVANWELLSAVGISSDGHFIVGDGIYKGNRRGFLLNLVLSVPSFPRETPIDILAGAVLDTGGRGLTATGRVVPFPTGPFPFQRAFREIVASLAALQISFQMRDSEARRAFQGKIISALRKATDKVVDSTH
jgi:probable HAF family extracellular repeat protein